VKDRPIEDVAITAAAVLLIVLCVVISKALLR